MVHSSEGILRDRAGSPHLDSRLGAPAVSAPKSGGNAAEAIR